MTHNLLHNAWSEKGPHEVEDEDLSDNVHKPTTGRRFQMSHTDDGTYSHLHSTDNSLMPNMNIHEDIPVQRRTRSSRYLATDDLEYDSHNMGLKHTGSTDSLFSRGSRNLARPSPPTSFRSLRNATILSSPKTRPESQKEGINIIMLIGFSIGIALGTMFNVSEVYLQWFQLKITELQLHLYGGKTIVDFYAQEQSVPKKLLYGPVSGIFLFFHFCVYILLISLHFLKKPAPKTLVSNVMMRYVNE